MTALYIAIALIVGAIGGAFAMQLLMKQSKKDAEKLAETLAASVVGKQTEQILRLAETKLSGKKEVIDGTLKSMQQNMGNDLKRLETLLREVGTGNTEVKTKLTNAATVIKELTETTVDLKTALSSNSGRGQWGERMAEDVLRLSGLIEGINYIKQKKLDASGSKPDFTFLLPQNRKLNMDVKFPFNNYQLYASATDEKHREECKKKFLKDVRDRVKEVQTRDYINDEDFTVDYVLLFVPNEQIFGFINEMDRALMDEAMRAKTILCSPLTLYAILSTIRQGIDNFSMESKSQEMLSIFGAFKQQWEKFKEQMETVRTRFESVHKGYEELVGARERQLDRQLTKIEEMRLERGTDAKVVEITAEAVTAKKAAAASRTLV